MTRRDTVQPEATPPGAPAPTDPRQRKAEASSDAAAPPPETPAREGEITLHTGVKVTPSELAAMWGAPAAREGPREEVLIAREALEAALSWLANHGDHGTDEDGETCDWVRRAKKLPNTSCTCGLWDLEKRLEAAADALPTRSHPAPAPPSAAAPGAVPVEELRALEERWRSMALDTYPHRKWRECRIACADELAALAERSRGGR